MWSIPLDLIRLQNRAGEARPDVMERAVVSPHRNDAAVTPAETEAHDSLDGHLAGPLVLHGGACRGRQHALRPAGIQHDRVGWRQRGKLPIEWSDDASALACAAVFSRQHERDVELAKE